MLRQIQLLFLELKQTGWLSLVTPLLVALTFLLMLHLSLSTGQEVGADIFATINGASVILPAVGAILWGYFYAGNVFERSTQVFFSKDTHYLTRITIRAFVSLLSFILASSGIVLLLAQEHTREIIFLTLRIISVSALVIGLISISAYLFRAASVGVSVSLFFILYSCGAYFGWIPAPMWLIPKGGEESLGYTIATASAAITILLSLSICEKIAKKD